MSERSWGIVSVKMTEDAAYRFNEALRYAEAVLHNKVEANCAPDAKRKIEEHGEWLRWGMGRLDEARRAIREVVG